MILPPTNAAEAAVRAFYDSVMPAHGLRTLAVFNGGLKAAPTHYFFDNNTAMLEAAAKFDGLGKNVYHGCASYATGANRKGQNVAAVKALWIDADVGPNKPYATKQEAAAAVAKFVTGVGLSAPYVVQSGYGVHFYFAFTKAITPEQWDRLAAVFAACLDHAGVKHDSSRTEDKASILRVPGTRNYKTDPAKRVKIVQTGAEATAGDVYRKLKTHAELNGVIAEAKIPRGQIQGTNELIGKQEYPPSYADRVIDKCAVLREVADSGGDVPYEIWWRAMGVAKFLQDADQVAEHWTRHRSQTGHDKHDWRKATDGWTVGPTTCAEFSKHSSKCAVCPSARLEQ